MTRIAFISSDTTRTGATILLLRLITLLRSSGFQTSVVIRTDNGPLAEDFAAQADKVLVYRQKNEGALSLAKRKMFRGTGRGFGGAFDGADLIINNTVGNGILLHSLRQRYPTPIASYVHELDTMARMHTDAQSVEYTMKYSNMFLVPSKAVADFLVREFKIEKSKIHALDYYIPSNERAKRQQRTGPLVIGGCGTVDWRKGFDLFIQTALYVTRNFKDVECRFVWKGADLNSNSVKHVGHELIRAGLPGLVEFAGSDANMRSFYQSLDVFLLTSREDPYPLVVLEAAAEQVPTVCFENSGGAPEFILPDRGQVVPYVDVARMAEAVRRYALDRSLLNSHGSNADKEVSEKHSRSSRIVQQLKGIMNAN